MRQLILLLMILIVSPSLFLSSNLAALGVAQNGNNTNAAAIATSVTQNLLTIVALLLGTSSFILGLSIQNFSRLSTTMIRYFRILILAMVIPSIVIIIYGIVIVGSTLDPGDVHYLLLLFALFVPAGAIIFLLSKLHSSIPDTENI